MGHIHKPRCASGALWELLESLHVLHVRAGEPSMRALAGQTEVLSHDTVHRVLTGPFLPRWGPLELVVEALHGDIEEFHAVWLAARVADDAQDVDS